MAPNLSGQRFRKRPVVVTAYRATETTTIATREGVMTANPGDWIVTGIAGEQYPVKPEIFEATYEPEEVPLAGEREWMDIAARQGEVIRRLVSLLADPDRQRVLVDEAVEHITDVRMVVDG